MKRKFIIFAPSYSELSGGVIALHKLCDLLNKSDNEAYLYPMFESYEFHPYNAHLANLMIQGWDSTFHVKHTRAFDQVSELEDQKQFYLINPEFSAPVLMPDPNLSFDDQWVIIYPEVTFGNPLRAKNVVRWLLHNPGFHTGKIYYSPNELYFRYSNTVNPFSFPGSKTSLLELQILHLPLGYYYKPELENERNGTAYCARKGGGSPVQHNLEDSILIDGKSHQEVANIFRSVKTFISYDPMTLYSNLAVLCGCSSVVIPSAGVSETEWQRDPRRHYGVAYGIENISKANATAHLALEGLVSIERDSTSLTRQFITQVEEYFYPRDSERLL